MLLLDEGDALMARRTDVANANDRYANLETNFLLQRLETFEGIVIVTTNAASSIDTAFLRRLDATIEFIPPDAGQRWQIWQAHLPIGHRVPAALLEEIARRCTLTGGRIRNASLHAALRALDAGPISTAPTWWKRWPSSTGAWGPRRHSPRPGRRRSPRPGRRRSPRPGRPARDVRPTRPPGGAARPGRRGRGAGPLAHRGESRRGAGLGRRRGRLPVVRPRVAVPVVLRRHPAQSRGRWSPGGAAPRPARVGGRIGVPGPPGRPRFGPGRRGSGPFLRVLRGRA